MGIKIKYISIQKNINPLNTDKEVSMEKVFIYLPLALIFSGFFFHFTHQLESILSAILKSINEVSEKMIVVFEGAAKRIHQIICSQLEDIKGLYSHSWKSLIEYCIKSLPLFLCLSLISVVLAVFNFYLLTMTFEVVFPFEPKTYNLLNKIDQATGLGAMEVSALAIVLVELAVGFIAFELISNAKNFQVRLIGIVCMFALVLVSFVEGYLTLYRCQELISLDSEARDVGVAFDRAGLIAGQLQNLIDNFQTTPQKRSTDGNA